MVICRRHQPFNRFNWLDAATSADASAVERSGGTGEFELVLKGPALQQTIDKTGVKDIAGSRCVRNFHAIGRGIVEFGAIPREYPSLAERRGA